MAIQTSSYANPRADLGQAFQDFDGRDEGFIGMQVLPIAETARKAATFSRTTREGKLKQEETKRAAKGNYNRVDSDTEDHPYSCAEHGLEGCLGDDERAFFVNDFDAEVDTIVGVRRKLLMAQEKRVADKVFNATTWTGADLFTDNSGSPWSTISTDVIGQIIDAVEKARQLTGLNPNTLIVSAAQVPNLLKNTGIRAQFPGAEVITLQMIRNAVASIVGVPNMLVGGGINDTAAEGQSFASGDIWSNTYAMVATIAAEGSSIRSPGIGRTMLWTEDSPENMTAESYREEQSRSWVYRTRHNVDENIIHPDYAHLLQIEV